MDFIKVLKSMADVNVYTTLRGWTAFYCVYFTKSTSFVAGVQSPSSIYVFIVLFLVIFYFSVSVAVSVGIEFESKFSYRIRTQRIRTVILSLSLQGRITNLFCMWWCDGQIGVYNSTFHLTYLFMWIKTIDLWLWFWKLLLHNGCECV